MSRPRAIPFTIRSIYIVRPGLLLLLLVGELSHLGIPLLSQLNPTLRGWWWPIVWNGRLLGEAAIGGLLVTIFLSWPKFRTALAATIHEGNFGRLNFWLGVHLACVALVAVWLFYGMRKDNFTAISASLWFFAGVVLLPGTAITWSVSIVPRTFWTRWLVHSRSAVAIGTLVGIFARSSGYFAQMLWPPLCRSTFLAVNLILRSLDLSVVSDPRIALIGTERFVVTIGPTCSGLEGIGLICVFLTSYLWFYRAEYRFPAALALIPSGIASIWILNAVRIATLILIGQRYSDIAVTGFHSVAGWIFFNLTAFGIVAASRRLRCITRTYEAKLSRGAVHAPNPGVPYLLPLLLTIGVGILTTPFTAGFDAAYPIRVIVAALAIWWCRERIGTALAEVSWMSATLGGLCFLFWIILAHPDHAANAAIERHLHSLSKAALTGWKLSRVIGAVFTVPLIEELAFRGYLLRKLIASNFESVPFDHFTWSSFIISSVAFGALHQSLIAGVLAGALFALAMYRTGRLASAVTAHATANALLASYVFATGYWSLW